jgi:hypothetical protein
MKEIRGKEAPIFHRKRYNPIYNLQTMPLEGEIDKVGAEEI